MASTNGKRRGPAGASAQTASGIVTRLKTMYATLPATAQRIADYILLYPNEVVHMSVTEVADASQVSDGSVVRMCHLIGTKGFQDLKIALARELVQPIQFIHEDLQKDDSIPTVVEKVFQSGIQALTDTLKVLDIEAMQKAVDIILNAERVEFYGIGSAAPVALDAYYRMLRIGINCVAVTDSHIQAVSAALTNERHAVVTISHSGSTHETVAATRIAHQAGAKTICITNYGKSPIQAYADVVLYTAARETQFRTESMTSRIAELAVVDALNTCVALANYERSLQTIANTFDVLSAKRF